MEQVRHLLFAEDMYLNRWILRNDQPWNKLGLLPAFLANDPHYAEVGSQAAEGLEAILTAWQGIHAHTRAVVTTLTPEELRRSTRDVDLGKGRWAAFSKEWPCTIYITFVRHWR